MRACIITIQFGRGAQACKPKSTSGRKWAHACHLATTPRLKCFFARHVRVSSRARLQGLFGLCGNLALTGLLIYGLWNAFLSLDISCIIHARSYSRNSANTALVNPTIYSNVERIAHRCFLHHKTTSFGLIGSLAYYDWLFSFFPRMLYLRSFN